MINPITTEKAVRLIELNNTLLFDVERKARKEEIKKEVEEIFKVKVASINTLIHLNRKVAYVKLTDKFPAIDVATKLGLI